MAVILDREDFMEATYEARDEFLGRLGEVHEDVIAPMMNPSFMGGPRWPDLRQAWKIVHRAKGRIALVSDGLSDPFDDEKEPNAGFGLEMFMESEDELEGAISGSWLMSAIYEVSQQAASHGNFRQLLDDLGLFSMTLNLSQDSLKSIANEAGEVGALFGVAPPYLQKPMELPGGSVKLCTVKLLFPSELEYVIKNQAAGREHLRDVFFKDETFHRSSLTRQPVV